MAGLMFGVADVVRASSSGEHWLGGATTVALFGLWLWFGQLLGAALWLFRCVAAPLKRRLKSELAWYGVLALLAAAVTLVLARKMSTGGGIRHTAVASVGPWLLPACTGLIAWIALWLAATLIAGGSTRVARWVVVSATAALSLGAAVLDAWMAGGYLYLHVFVLLVAAALATQAIERSSLPRGFGHAALLASFVAVPSLVAFPASRVARELSAQPTWAGKQLIDYVQFHVDFDRDGHSPAFGGDDCDDANASVYVGAPERLNDGVDSDCDGQDNLKPSTRAYAPFRVSKDGQAARIAERAHRFPTVVILVDALRFDRVGDPRFPNLATLARESIRFTSAYSTAATTLSSVPAMMTGCVRPATGRDDIGRSLARAGQSSFFIAPDVITEHFAKLSQSNPLRSFSVQDAIATDRTKGWGAGDTAPTSEQLTARAVERLDSPSPPELLWIHYFDVHQWNVLSEPGLPEQGGMARYDAVLAGLDASLRPLLDRRDRLSIVLLADHGEALDTRGVRYHGNYVFQELAHIPLLVRVPGIAPATVDVPVSGTGVFNALRSLRGLDTDASVDPSVLSLVGEQNVGEGPGFAAFDNIQWSFLHGQYRLLYTPRQQLVELYDLRQDPRELKNRADANPRLAAELLARLFEINNAAPR